LKRPLVAKRALNHVETDASGVRRSVLAEYAALLKSYGFTRVIGDRYGGMWPRERFAAHGIDSGRRQDGVGLLPRASADLEQRSC
jgi:hypothetical protein